MSTFPHDPRAAPRDPKVLDHEYDGIQEFDNPTPGWWHAIFFVTIVFSIGYAAFWDISPMAWSNEQAWQARQVTDFRRVFGAIGELKPDEPTVLSMMGNDQMLAVADGIFRTNCAACHGSNGGAAGLTGVNLTDDVYKNVKAFGDILNTINKGANNGAMPAWENRLSQNERIILAAYAAKLRGTNVPGGKPAEGEAPAPWPQIPAAQPPGK